MVRLKAEASGNQRLQYRAGQYLDFLLTAGGVLLRSPRTFDDEFIELRTSVTSTAANSPTAFNQMKERSILRIQAPLGTFVLEEDSERPMIFHGRRHRFAPLKGQIEQASARR